MNYIYTQNKNDVVEYLVSTLRGKLTNNLKVLWLSSGGSSIDLTVRIANKLKNDDLSNLYFSLVDERYGQIGHADENWQQLLDSGFSLGNAKLYRPLISQAEQITTTRFAGWIDASLDVTDFSIGLFGIGGDGHTAGIKPHSRATDSKQTVEYYPWDDYRRITITPDVITRLDLIITQAFGEDKNNAIHQLLESDTSIDQQPAQVLKRAKRSILYTDYKKEEIV